MSMSNVKCSVNGLPVQREVNAARLLSDFIREDLTLTGTKRGCETGVCGACSVLVDGEVVKSCLLLACQIDGSDVTTIEGLEIGGELHPLQAAFMEFGGLQCGFCTPGFIMAACSLLNDNESPSEHDIRHGLSGNICRCTGYMGIVKAIQMASEKIRAT